MAAPGLRIATINHDMNERHAIYTYGKVTIKKNAWIGMNVTICPGVTIGEYAVVAAGAVGRGMKDSGVKREDIFLSTKLWPSEYENPNAVDETLERLGVDYVDLHYIHQPAGNWLAGYRQLEKAYKEGKAKSIGISNFEGKYIEELETKWDIVPQFIQVEAHPYFTQKELRKTLDKYDIKLMSWYPLGHGDKSLINKVVL